MTNFFCLLAIALFITFLTSINSLGQQQFRQTLRVENTSWVGFDTKIANETLTGWKS
jgi:hypothetical protein